MAKGPRVEKEALLSAGLALMAQNGQPLTRRPLKGSAKLYELPNGESVRVRTCNDHILITVAEHPGEGASLNIEGTDWILLVMPEVPRSPGPVRAYLLPTEKVVQDVREAHKRWLTSGPDTKGKNTTWNVHLDDRGPPHVSGYARKWASYLVPGEARTDVVASAMPISENARSDLSLGEEISSARQRIARVAGVSVEAVRITIDFGA